MKGEKGHGGESRGLPRSEKPPPGKGWKESGSGKKGGNPNTYSP